MPKFDHAVKYNGKYYPAGADIPEAAPAEETPWKYEGPDTSGEETAQETAEVEAEATAEEQPEAPEKATKRRKKGDT